MYMYCHILQTTVYIEVHYALFSVTARQIICKEEDIPAQVL